MPRAPLSDEAPGFAKGLDLVSTEAELDPQALRVAAEVRLTTFGAATRRGGTQRVMAAALGGAVRGGFAWRRAGLPTQDCVVANGTLVTAAAGAFVSGAPVTWTARAGALSTTARVSLVDFWSAALGADAVYLADGGPLNRWNGTTLATDLAGTPASAQLAVWNQRLFAIGDAANPEQLSWSGLNDGDSLGVAAAGGGTAAVRTYGGRELTALAPLRDALLLFHRQGISRFSGTGYDDINIQAGMQGVTGAVGTTAPGSLVVVENVAYFLDASGFYAATESDVQPISPLLTPLFRTLNQTLFARVEGVHDRARREIRWYLPDVGCYVYQYDLHAWSGPWVGGLVSDPTRATWESEDATGAPVVLRGTSAGWVERCDAPGIPTDGASASGAAGSGYTLRLTPRRFYAQDASATKSWRYAYLIANRSGATSLALAWQTAQGTQGAAVLPTGEVAWGAVDTVWGAGIWGGLNYLGAQSLRVAIDGRGTWCDLTITDSGPGACVLSRCDLEAFALGRRGL